MDCLVFVIDVCMGCDLSSLIKKRFKSNDTSSGKSCYYFEDISGNAYISACPWEPVKEEEKKEDAAQEEEAETDEESE